MMTTQKVLRIIDLSEILLVPEATRGDHEYTRRPSIQANLGCYVAAKLRFFTPGPIQGRLLF
jgi:hypothetical protein